MHHFKVLPAGPLFPVVKKYLINYSSPPSIYVLPVVPSGNVYLLFTHAESARIIFKSREQKIQPGFSVGGQVFREQIQVLCSGYVEFIFVELHPIALYYLYKRPLQTFTDKFIAIDAFAEHVQKDMMLSTSGIWAKLSLIKSFLKLHLPTEDILKDDIFCLTQWIEQREGGVRIEEMSKYLGCSKRQVERIFLEKIGISPKYYTKLVQMRQIINLVMEKGNRPLVDVLYAKGHYDAAHFNKDFKRILHMNPLQFIQKGAPLVKQLLKQKFIKNAY